MAAWLRTKDHVGELTLLSNRYNTIKGDMVAIEGEEWTLVEPLSTISWNSPRGVAPQWEADVRYEGSRHWVLFTGWLWIRDCSGGYCTQGL